eukprot:TRINITY_DN2412_c0_g1_i1.p1 TRINITY_DN2412_c0_g1~~TRINITY_DN2412_c0_g1_i1.p1  ORF type:complete len:858 (-),score=288.63 TRINITY_DN2412_c0_g1_i1:363-2936(-)
MSHQHLLIVLLSLVGLIGLAGATKARRNQEFSFGSLSADPGACPSTTITQLKTACAVVSVDKPLFKNSLILEYAAIDPLLNTKIKGKVSIKKWFANNATYDMEIATGVLSTSEYSIYLKQSNVSLAGTIPFSSFVPLFLGISDYSVFRTALDKVFVALDNPRIVVTEMYMNANPTNFGIRFAAELHAKAKLADINVLYLAKSNAFMVHSTIPLSSLTQVANASFTSGNSLIQDLRAIVNLEDSNIWFSNQGITLADATALKFAKITKDQDAGFGMDAGVKINQDQVLKRTSGIFQGMLQRVNSSLKTSFLINSAKAQWSLTLPDIILSQTSEHVLTFLGPIIDITAQHVPPAIGWGVSAGLAWRNFVTGTDFKFRAGFSLDTLGIGTITLTQEGVVNNPFNLPKTQLLGCTASLKIGATPPFIVGGQLVGTLVIGTNVPEVNVSALQITAGVSIDPKPTSNWIYASVNALRLGDFIYAFGYNDNQKYLKLSPNLRESGLSELAFSTAIAAQTITYTDPATRLITSIPVDAGVMAAGKINLYGWKGAVKVVVNPAAPYLAINISCDPITVGSIISLTRSEKEVTLGPKFDIQAGKIGSSVLFSGEVRGFLNVAGVFSAGVAIQVNPDGFYASVSTSFLALSASLSLTANWASFRNLSFEIDASIAIGSDSSMGKTILDTMTSGNTTVKAEPNDNTCALLEVAGQVGEASSAAIDAEFQAMIYESHQEAALTGQDSYAIFQEKLRDWHEERNSLVEVDEDMEVTGICSFLRDLWYKIVSSFFSKFNVQLSFKLRLGSGWFVEVAYSMTFGSTNVSGALRVDTSTLTGIKQVLEACWAKFRDWVKSQSSALLKYVKTTLF